MVLEVLKGMAGHTRRELDCGTAKGAPDSQYTLKG